MVIIYDYIAGALGGICGLFISHPFDTIKVTLQLKASKDRKPIFQTIKQVAKGGLKNGIYRGLGFPLCSNAFQNSIFFGTYGFVLSTLNKSQDGRGLPDGANMTVEKNYLHVYIAGCMAGLAQVPIFCPPDRIKVVLQSQLDHFAFVHDKRPSGTAKTLHGSRPLSTNRQTMYFYGPREASLWLYQKYGWRGAFYRGFGCAILRDMNALSVYVVSYEFLKDQLYARLGNSKKSEILSTLAGGAVAGSLSWITTMPFDVLKNVYQSDITHVKYKNPLHCARQLYQEYGLRVFYRGVVVVSLQALPVNAVIFLTYSQSLKAFQTWHYSNKMEEVTDIAMLR